jgi:hypothetical protein
MSQASLLDTESHLLSLTPSTITSSVDPDDTGYVFNAPSICQGRARARSKTHEFD